VRYRGHRVGGVKQDRGHSQGLSPGGTPVGAAGARRLLVSGSGSGSDNLRLASHSAKHDTTSKDSGLATIVVGHLGLRGVDENACLPGTLATRELVGRLVAGDGSVGPGRR